MATYYCKAEYFKRSPNAKSLVRGELVETIIVLRNKTDKRRIGKYLVRGPVHEVGLDDEVHQLLRRACKRRRKCGV
jgi:hypothetical protein